MYNKLLRQSWGAATQGQRAPAIWNCFIINSLDHAIQYGHCKSCDCVGLGMTTFVDMLSALPPALPPPGSLLLLLIYFLMIIPQKKKKRRGGAPELNPSPLLLTTNN